MSSNPVYIPYKRTGFSHHKCYLRETKGCSDKLSSEHYLSENILNKIERINTTIDVTGLSWLPKERLKSIGKSSLVSNILCTQHNSDLSALDSIDGELIDGIACIDAEFNENDPVAINVSIDGVPFERWIIKTVIGLVESNQIRQKSGQPFVYKKKCLKST